MILHPHLLNLDFNLIKVLYVLLHEPNTTKAAATLNISQPAVSKALTKLRGYFDDELFVRSGNRLVPTPLAQKLADTTPDLLRSLISTLVTPLHLPAQEWEGDFFIAGPLEILDDLAANIWKKMTPLTPKLKPMFKSVTADFSEELISGKTNLVLTYSEDNIGPELMCQPILELNNAIMCRQGHPLSKKKTVTIDDLQAFDLVIAKTFHQGSEQLIDMKEKCGIKSRLAGVFHSVSAAQQIIRETDSFGFCLRDPQSLIEGVVSVPFIPNEDMQMSLYLVYPRYMKNNTDYQWLLKQVTDAILDGQSDGTQTS